MSCSLHNKEMAGLEILDARYGAVGSNADMKDVTEKVKNKISSDKQTISFVVSSTNLGIEDPSVGNPKEMKVKYAMNGDQRSEVIRDGNTFALKLPQTGPTTPIGYAMTFYGIIFKNVLTAVMIFLNVFGIAMAYNLGWYFGVGIVWALISIIFPYASFWMIPVIVILARAFSGIDFIRP